MKREEALSLMNFKDKEKYGKLSNEAIALKLTWSYNINEDVISENDEVKA